MITIRRFSPDLKTKVPRGHPGVFAVPIQFDKASFAHMSTDLIAERFNGQPIMIDSPTSVVAMYIEPHGSIDEHHNSNFTLFIVLKGAGYVRLGGQKGEERAISAGDAVLWPSNIDHTVWTEEEALEAIVIEVDTGSSNT
ncbi:cupin domain-containing protein [Ktedonospora formicarum]|uniref:Cupin type-2 domain-containing protein n=1 Tax=Ktedonospora formicarum TaxID=2778364 RepID=A0A8J3I9P6_9CHLR|nr:cupin domain-containing protein [Ktedonospora formicarum]GHO49395.1 hypothetical protein KSX_75580 [Ktedonospora formicarum]